MGWEIRGYGAAFLGNGVIKKYQGSFEDRVRASRLWDMELEFLDSRIFKMNYWGKVGIMIFGKTTWGAGSKLLGKREMRGAMGGKHTRKK